MLAIYAYLSIYSVECGVAVYLYVGSVQNLKENKLIVSTLLFYHKTCLSGDFQGD